MPCLPMYFNPIRTLHSEHEGIGSLSCMMLSFLGYAKDSKNIQMENTFGIEIKPTKLSPYKYVLYNTNVSLMGRLTRM